MKYPKQICSAASNKKMLGVDGEFNLPGEKDSPLEQNSLSRFVFTIIDKTSGKGVPASANIPVKEINSMKIRTELAVGKLIESKTVKSDGGSANSVAYTQKLFTGTLKGRTPADILSNSPELKGELEKQRKFLKEHEADYSANPAQIKAIDEALQLFNDGKLTKADNGSSVGFPIYKSEYKYMRTKNEHGENLIYKIEINFEPAMNNPFTVVIENSYAPVVKEGKMTKIKFSEAKNKSKTRNSFVMSESSWTEFMRCMEKRADEFNLIKFDKQWRLSDANSYHKSEKEEERNATVADLSKVLSTLDEIKKAIGL